MLLLYAYYIHIFFWCRGGDSNPYRISPTDTSSLRVYQFHHLGNFHKYSEKCITFRKSYQTLLRIKKEPATCIVIQVTGYILTIKNQRTYSDTCSDDSGAAITSLCSTALIGGSVFSADGVITF